MPLNPRMFTPGSHIKVWWKCKQGHEWETIVRNRSSGSDCPTCNLERKRFNQKTKV